MDAAAERIERFNDKDIKSCVTQAHQALAMALQGEFDKYWEGSHKVMWKGHPREQREVFFENIMGWLPAMDQELLRRKLHVK